MVIKKADVTEEMKNAMPIGSKDIGCGSKILVLKKYRDGSYLTCLERDGQRINFTRSKPYVQGGSGAKYITKTDGYTPQGAQFKRYIRVDGMRNPVQHRRIRTATQIVEDNTQLSLF